MAVRRPQRIVELAFAFDIEYPGEVDPSAIRRRRVGTQRANALAAALQQGEHDRQGVAADHRHVGLGSGMGPMARTRSTASDMDGGSASIEDFLSIVNATEMDAAAQPGRLGRYVALVHVLRIAPALLGDRCRFAEQKHESNDRSLRQSRLHHRPISLSAGDVGAEAVGFRESERLAGIGTP
ncbi:MAG TPA: hypothetical protein VK634_04025 [Reyranella sp.]|nr:hypothetical protein [Reyranella sp.]